MANLWTAWKDERETLEEMKASVARARAEESFLRAALEDLDALREEASACGALFIVAANQSWDATRAAITVPELAQGNRTRLLVLREDEVGDASGPMVH